MPKDINIQKTLALLMVCSFIGLIYLTWIKPPPVDPTIGRVLDTLTGLLGAWCAQAIQFNFGSATKPPEGQTITTSTSTPVPPPPPAPPAH